MSTYQLGMHAVSGTPAMQTYAPAANPVQNLYQSMMPPTSYTHQVEPLHPAQRYMKPDSAQSPRHSHHPASLTSMPPPSSPVIQTHPTSLGRVRGSSEMKSPSSATGRQQQHSPLSLASITSPYNSESQPKNYHAQTLTLGECLRRGPPQELHQAREDPATLFGGIRLIYRHRHRPRRVANSRRQPLNCTWIVPPADQHQHRCQYRHRLRRPFRSLLPCRRDQGLGGIAIRHSFYPVSRQPEMARTIVTG